MKKSINPLVEKYSGKDMIYNFSPEKKFITWRKLWIYLAKIQMELGIKNITNEQICNLEKNLNNFDWNRINILEKKFRHDVVAHIHAFGEKAYLAKPILHIGVTSAFVGDNTDLILMKDGLNILLKKMINILFHFRNFSLEYHDTPTLGYTHYQPAQLTTVGKRSALWMQSLILDIEELEFRLNNLKLRGVKGTIGTGATFKYLFNGNFDKLKYLEKKISDKFGFQNIFPITGQTYDRKIDSHILFLLSNISQSAHKFSNDIRLLQNLQELEESFEEEQVGSSAMSYKRNPILCERLGSLSKYVIAISINAPIVSSTQWLERTLDDSASRRLVIPQAFLSLDAILILWEQIIKNINVYENIISNNVNRELPFLITEYLIIECVKQGCDRQKIHEKIRKHAMKTVMQMKIKNSQNDFIDRIVNDNSIPIEKETIEKIMNPKKLIGFSSEQTIEFISKKVNPILKKYKHLIFLDKKI